MRRIIFKALYWSYEETDDNELYIYIGGKSIECDKKGENLSVICRVDNFPPVVHLELPKKSSYGRVHWNKSKCKKLFNYFCSTNARNAPLSYKLAKKRNFYYNEPFNAMTLYFPTHKTSIYFGADLRRRNLSIPGVGSFPKNAFKLHEQNIDPVIKLVTLKKLKMSGWIEAKEKILEGEEQLDVEDRKFSTADIDLYVHWKNLKEYVPNNINEGTGRAPDPPIPQSITIRYLSFDGEMYSKNHNSKLSDPEEKENDCFQIGIQTGILHSGKSKKIMLSVGKHKEIPGTKSFFHKKEKNLLLHFAQIINDFQPDIFIHYNGMNFDWKYLIERARMLGIYNRFMKFSKIIGEKARIGTARWESSAYGKQRLIFADPVGIVNVDGLLEVQRNFKMPSYSLNVVGKKFVGESKDDISYRQLFMLRQMSLEVSEKYLDKDNITREDLENIKIEVKRIFLKRFSEGGVVKILRRKLLKAKLGNIKDYLLEPLYITGKYCIQDVKLTTKVIEVLNMDKSMEAMSNVANIPMSYIHTRGQQIKVVSQIYRETVFRNIVIPYPDKTKKHMDYQGATVFAAIPGYHKLVNCLDFESLYPSIMRALNICMTTLLKPKDPYPDEKAFVSEWEDHVRCPHDKVKRTGQGRKLCLKQRHRFKRPKWNPDGTVEGVGLIPKMLGNLLTKRKAVKKKMNYEHALIAMHTGDATEEDRIKYKEWEYPDIQVGQFTEEEEYYHRVQETKYNAEQQALKVSANSTYGALGAKKGYIPLIPGAAVVTATGRKLIALTVKAITEKYPCARNVYGDSVTGNTPILCRLGDKVFYCSIENIPREHNFGGKNKEYAHPIFGLEVWSDQGWTKVKGIIRHFCKKKIYRVSTFTGIIDVTEDHSLLNEDGREISPKEIVIGEKLLHQDLPECRKSVSPRDKKTKVDWAIEYWKRNNNITKSNLCLLNEDNNYYFYEAKNELDYEENKNIIWEKKCLGYVSDYVYDIETNNSHFSAGIGRIVVHNTDSTMMRFEGKNVEESWVLATKACEYATYYLRCYLMGVDYKKKYLIMKGGKSKGKKKYLCDITKEEAKYLSDDDKCIWHEYVNNPINLEHENMYGKFFQLTKKRYRAIKYNKTGKVIGKIDKGSILVRRDTCNYARGPYGEILDAIMPMDQYQEPASKDEALKILYGWVDKLFIRQIPDKDLIIYIGVNEILEYAKKKVQKNEFDKKDNPYIDPTGNEFTDPTGIDDPRMVFSNIPQVLLALKIIRRGDKVPPNTRLEFIYIENPKAQKRKLHLGDSAEDYTYYIENRKELGLKPDRIIYLENKLSNPVMELFSVMYLKEEVKYKGKIEDVYRILRDDIKNEVIKNRIMRHRRIKDQLDYILDIKRPNKRGTLDGFISVKKKRGKNDITEKKYPEFVNIAKRYKSKLVIDQIYNNHGLKKRSYRKSVKRGENTYIRDITLMKNIVKARRYYKDVVDHLNELFCEVEIIGE